MQHTKLAEAVIENVPGDFAGDDFLSLAYLALDQAEGYFNQDDTMVICSVMAIIEKLKEENEMAAEEG